MIPKIIHYCWFGGAEKPKIIKKCIKSWKKYCPDYEIIEWNENNFDFSDNLFAQAAYENKKWAFVSDYVRLKVLYDYGGVYLDTDEKLMKPLDDFLDKNAFFGFMNKYEISGGVIGASKECELIGEFLEYYEKNSFDPESKTANTVPMTEKLVEKGLIIDSDSYQVIEGAHIFPQTYFCPTSCITVENCISDKTVGIHMWASSWHSEQGRKNMKREKFHTTKRYKALIWLRYLPNRLIRFVLGDKAIDRLKEKLKK